MSIFEQDRVHKVVNYDIKLRCVFFKITLQSVEPVLSGPPAIVGDRLIQVSHCICVSKAFWWA